MIAYYYYSWVIISCRLMCIPSVLILIIILCQLPFTIYLWSPHVPHYEKKEQLLGLTSFNFDLISFKNGVGQNIASSASHAARNSVVLISAFPVHQKLPPWVAGLRHS